MMKTKHYLAGILLLIAGHSQVQAKKIETAILAGGCFWCIEADFEKLDGVISAVSGYIGGHTENPTYHQVSSGKSGHLEAVEIRYDADVLDYPAILEHFWKNIDPTRNDGQFCDRGPQYRPAIFYLDDRQKQQAEASMAHIRNTKSFPQPLKVELLPAGKFHIAEKYHQDYYKKNPLRYKYYRYRCGRDQRLEELWGN